MLLKACAARNRVAPRLIADADDLERIAVEDEPDVAALKGWRYELFGQHAEQPEARRAGAQGPQRRGGMDRAAALAVTAEAQAVGGLSGVSAVGALAAGHSG